MWAWDCCHQATAVPFFIRQHVFRRRVCVCIAYSAFPLSSFRSAAVHTPAGADSPYPESIKSSAAAGDSSNNQVPPFTISSNVTTAIASMRKRVANEGFAHIERRERHAVAEARQVIGRVFSGRLEQKGLVRRTPNYCQGPPSWAEVFYAAAQSCVAEVARDHKRWPHLLPRLCTRRSAM